MQAGILIPLEICSDAELNAQAELYTAWLTGTQDTSFDGKELLLFPAALL